MTLLTWHCCDIREAACEVIEKAGEANELRYHAHGIVAYSDFLKVRTFRAVCLEELEDL